MLCGTINYARETDQVQTSNTLGQDSSSFLIDSISACDTLNIKTSSCLLGNKNLILDLKPENLNDENI